MDCQFFVEDTLVKTTIILRRFKRVYLTDTAPPLLSISSRQRLSRASQRQIEAF
jgi:hypothetical protein